MQTMLKCDHELKESIIDFNGLKAFCLLYIYQRWKVPNIGKINSPLGSGAGADDQNKLLYPILYELASLNCLSAAPQIAYKDILHGDAVRRRPIIHFIYPKEKATKLINRFLEYNQTSFIKQYDYGTKQSSYINYDLAEPHLITKISSGGTYLALVPGEILINNEWVDNMYVARNRLISPSLIEIKDEPMNNISIESLIKSYDFNELLMLDFAQNAVAISIVDMKDEEMSNKMFTDLVQAAYDVYL